MVELKELCDRRGIKHVAVIDDVFDVPAADGVDRRRYTEFADHFRSDERLRRAVERVGGSGLAVLPSFDDLGEDELEPLWTCAFRTAMGRGNMGGRQARIVRELFEEHRHDVLGALSEIRGLVELFHRDLGRRVTVHGRFHEPSDVVGAQVVVVDYFLERACTDEQAREMTSEVVRRIADTARAGGRSVPQFLLVSSRPDEIEVEVFRKRARLMKSRFRFFTKKTLGDHSLSDLVNLHDLVDASDRTEKVEQLVQDWRVGGHRAVNAVEERILGLDVSDLVYLDHLRLVSEGTNIGEYLLWFLTNSVSSRMTEGLDRTLWRDAARLRLVEAVDGDGKVDPGTLIKTFDGPSREIAEAYGEILLDRSRSDGSEGFPEQLTGGDLLEGDLFVGRKVAGASGYEGAEVRLVMTPSCDLIRRGPKMKPAAKSVLLLSGTLTSIGDLKTNDLTDVYFVNVPGNREKSPLCVEWDLLRPVAVDWSTMALEGPGRGFRRLGRVRELYFHRIREHFSRRLVHIGTRVAPPLPRARAGEVWVRVKEGGKKKFVSVMEFSAGQRYVWEICPVRSGRGTQCVYLASRRFVCALIERLRQIEAEGPDWADQAAETATMLMHFNTQADLVRPLPSGRRGEGAVVEIRKPAKREAGSVPGSQWRANVVVQTYA